jgi:hypothetical protein
MKAVKVKLDPETIHMFDELQQQFSLFRRQPRSDVRLVVKLMH